MEALPALVSRLETVAVKLETLTFVNKSDLNSMNSSTAQSSNGSPSTTPSVFQFEKLVTGPLAQFLSLSETIGGVVKDQVSYFSY
jgi:hypothetical protein